MRIAANKAITGIAGNIIMYGVSTGSPIVISFESSWLPFTSTVRVREPLSIPFTLNDITEVSGPDLVPVSERRVTMELVSGSVVPLRLILS